LEELEELELLEKASCRACRGLYRSRALLERNIQPFCCCTEVDEEREDEVRMWQKASFDSSFLDRLGWLARMWGVFSSRRDGEVAILEKRVPPLSFSSPSRTYENRAQPSPSSLNLLCLTLSP
jgi:hypothetical protein